MDILWIYRLLLHEIHVYIHGYPYRWQPCCIHFTRGVQKVRSLAQLTTRYAHHTLSLFSCNWNALGPAFLQRFDTVVGQLLFMVFQPVICHAIRTRMANTVGDGVVQSRHFGLQPVLELTCDQMHCPGSKWLLFFPKPKDSWKDTKFSDDEDVICTAYDWLEDQEQQFFYNEIQARIQDFLTGGGWLQGVPPFSLPFPPFPSPSLLSPSPSPSLPPPSLPPFP